jgi:hypothetical protein
MSNNDQLHVRELFGARKSGGRMMRITVVSELLLLAALATPAFSQSFLGEWTATAHAPGGDFSETLSVTKTDSGYAIAVTLVQPLPEGMPEAGPGTDIVLGGDKFSYKRTATMPDGAQLTIAYTGVVTGDKFTATVDMGFTRVSYTGVRKKR